MVWLVALEWGIVAIGCWIGYQLIRQNGRILVHLESLQQQLTDLKSRPVLAPPAMPAGLEVGTPAPAFELPDISGQIHRLSEWQGRRLLLIFFNRGCGLCRQMAPDLAALPVVEVNQTLNDEPQRANDDPMGEGWFFTIHVRDSVDLATLMDDLAYRRLIGQA